MSAHLPGTTPRRRPVRLDADTRPPERLRAPDELRVVQKKPAPAKVSWWIGLGRQDLWTVANERQRSSLPTSDQVEGVKVTRV